MEFNDRKPAIGQKYENAIGYDDNWAEECCGKYTNISYESIEKKYSIFLTIMENVSDSKDGEKLCDILRIIPSEMLLHFAKKNIKMESVLNFLFENVKTRTLVCSIFIKTEEGKFSHKDCSSEASSRTSTMSFGHHVLLCIPLTCIPSIFFPHLPTVIEMIQKLIKSEKGFKVHEYFFSESTALFDYNERVNGKAIDIFLDLSKHQFLKMPLPLYVELPTAEKSLEFQDSMRDLILILKFKNLMFMIKEKFVANDVKDAYDTIFGHNLKGVSAEFYLRFQQLELTHKKLFPPTMLSQFYTCCSEYLNTYFSIFTSTKFLPIHELYIVKHIEISLTILKEMPYKKYEKLWFIEMDDKNSKEITEKYLKDKFYILATNKTKHVVETIYNENMIGVLSNETKWKETFEPVLISNTKDEFLLGIAIPTNVIENCGNNGDIYLSSCECNREVLKSWICNVCKDVLFLLKGTENLKCKCGILKQENLIKQCFSCRNKKRAIPEKRSFEERKTFNILFLGQIGAGKSMLINSIYNYVNYSFNEIPYAASVECIVPCQLQLQTPDFVNLVIKYGPKNDNEHFNEIGQSVTQIPKVYCLKTKKYDINIIDTPGLGDSRGPKQDKQNFDLISKAITDTQYLHAICFIIPSVAAKWKANFEEHMRQLFSFLPRSALKNIFFFVTYSNSPFFVPKSEKDDSRNVLAELIKNFETTNNVEIPFGEENVFCVDSKAFMYFIAEKQGHKYQDQLKLVYAYCWNKSKEEIEKFFSKLENIVPIKTNYISKIHGLNQIEKMLQNEKNNFMHALTSTVYYNHFENSLSDNRIEKEIFISVCNYIMESEELLQWINDQIEIAKSEDDNTTILQYLKYKFDEFQHNIESKETRFIKCDEMANELIHNTKQFAPDILKRQEKLREIWDILYECKENRAKKLIEAEEVCKNSLLPKIIPQRPDNHDIFDLPKRTTMNQDVDAVGIDLGTSRCCVAVNRKNGIHTVALENTGERLLPSYVAYDEENIKCGQIVIDRLRYFSEATVFDSKRIIGKCIVNVDKIWPFKIKNINNQPIIILKTERGEIRQSATEVAAALLKFMKTKAEEFQGKKLSKVVITVPAAFTEAQEEATKEAAILAGWETVKLLPEPIAASFAYFIDRPIPNNSILLLFDLGGGTLDVCVFKIINNQIQIISKNGDSKLGGRDFDNILMDYFSNKLNLDYDISKMGINMLNMDNAAANKLIYEDEISKLKNKKFKLLMECQKIKHNLSVRNEDQLDSSDIDLSLNGFIKITQKNFKDLSEDLLNRIQNTIFSALYKSGFKANQINKVLQVGGGCRMPMIKELLQELFPFSEHCCEEHPDEVVAIGAAHYAYNIFSN